MTASQSPDGIDPDDIQHVQLLDQLMLAVQTNDTRRCDQLLQEHPQLRDWIGCLKSLDSFAPAKLVPEFAETMLSDRSPASVPPAMSSNESDRFGKYDLLGEIGRGGMGVVYKARQRDLNRIVALKMILASERASAEEVSRFQIEARAAARLRHRNIVGIFEVGEEQGRHFFAMDFVEGKSLAAVIAHKPLPVEQAARWMVSMHRLSNICMRSD